MKNIYCTIDTETVGGATNPTGAYNYGAIIHDKQGNILASTSLLVMEHYDEIAKDEYAKKNFPLYQERMHNGTISAVATEQDALNIIDNLCRRYGVKYLMAYNSGFDFVKTRLREMLNNYEFIDIYLMALQTITHLKKYADFCRENNFKARSGKSCATTAESVYAFITGNADYKEEHTALNDALIEKDIFVRCANMHKRYNKNVHAWDCKENKCYPKWEK